jgi:EAL domain-containing protein (putative c-di-GMP-specific phosphodiesterase class I)
VLISDAGKPRPRPAPLDLGSAACAGTRVLIVEDDRGLLEAYTDTLLERGFEVAAAADAAAALRALAARPFDAVVSDVVLPGATGIDILQAVRARDLELPVVLVTGNPTVETAVSALELGALHYLVKPVATAELVRCVEHAVQLRRLAAARREAFRHVKGAASLGERAGLEALFSRSLAALFMAYQPIVRTRDGSVFGWEALLRTREASVAGPLAFIGMAERLDRVRELGRTIRDNVAVTAGHTRGVMFFVNLHAEDLEDEALYDPASPLSALAPEIVLEITERNPLEGVPQVRERVERLRSLGFRLAVDDLGSGYSGLASFACLEPDFVKLDRGLIHGIDLEPVKKKVVGSIVSVSRDLGVTVIAEGIETAAERDAAAEVGADLLQGFFFRRPEELHGAQSFTVGGSLRPEGESQDAA